MINTRFQSLSTAMQEAGLDALVLNPSPSLVHLTGLHFHLFERPVVFIYRPGSPPVLVLPELESSKLIPPQVMTSSHTVRTLKPGPLSSRVPVTTCP